MRRIRSIHSSRLRSNAIPCEIVNRLLAHTLRYYERAGLIAPVARAPGGQRRYAASDMEWIGFLLRLRETQMPIGQMQAFARLRSEGNATAPERRQLLEQHLAQVLATITAMQQAAHALQAKIEHYQGLEASLRPTPSSIAPMSPETQPRYLQGLAKLREIDGHAGERVVASLADIAPDFARYLIEFPFGDIYSRPGLDLRSREIAVVAALTAMGNATPQLKVHLQSALNVGVTREEIVEVLMQMAVYAGFPAALNGLTAAREVFAAADEQPVTA